MNNGLGLLFQTKTSAMTSSSWGWHSSVAMRTTFSKRDQLRTMAVVSPGSSTPEEPSPGYPMRRKIPEEICLFNQKARLGVS